MVSNSVKAGAWLLAGGLIAAIVSSNMAPFLACSAVYGCICVFAHQNQLRKQKEKPKEDPA